MNMLINCHLRLLCYLKFMKNSLYSAYHFIELLEHVSVNLSTKRFTVLTI